MQFFFEQVGRAKGAAKINLTSAFIRINFDTSNEEPEELFFYYIYTCIHFKDR
jgi:hypothetical protein